MRVDLEVEGRDEGSGLDSQLLIQSMVQFGYLNGVRAGGSTSAGVLGGVDKRWPAKGADNLPSICSSTCSKSLHGGKASVSKSAIAGSSMLGMGMSAAATDARNCCVGAARCWASCLFRSRRRGRGVQGVWHSPSPEGSGVFGAAKRPCLSKVAASSSTLMLGDGQLRNEEDATMNCRKMSSCGQEQGRIVCGITPLPGHKILRGDDESQWIGRAPESEMRLAD